MSRTIIITLAIIAAMAASSVSASPLSAMSAEEVSVLLKTAPAKDAAHTDNATAHPVAVTARDMVMKVYGILDECGSMQECVNNTDAAINLVPELDEDALWLDPDTGYVLNYYGRQPEVSALAHFGNGPESPVSDFGYFFLFPYDRTRDENSANQQIDFTSVLLQEMHDLGIPMAMRDGDPAALFAAVGDYEGNLVDIRLLDDEGDNGSGRYILILSVEPGAFTDADIAYAE